MDSNTNDATTVPASIAIEATGDINVTGDIRNEMNHQDASVTIQSIGGVAGINGDVFILANVETTSGSILIDANDTISLGSQSRIASGLLGDVSLTAGIDGIVDDDFSRILFNDGASIVTDAGSVSLNTATGGDILLGNVDSGSSTIGISIDSGGDILDNTASETANLVSLDGEININAAGSVGGAAPNNIDFFKATQADYDSIETASRVVNGMSGDRFFIQELTSSNTNFTIDTSNAYINSIGDVTFQNNSSSLANLTLLSDQIISLPTTLTVTNDLRVEGADDVQTANGNIVLTADRLLFSSGSNANLLTSANQIDASAEGNLSVQNRTSVEFLDLNCDQISAFSNSNNGNILIRSAANLIVTDDIVAGSLDGNSSSGNIEISGVDIEIQDAIIADDGSISVAASNNLAFDTLGHASTIAGNIELIAAGEIAMTDGSSIVAGRISGAFDPGNPSLVLNGSPMSGAGGTTSLVAGSNISVSSIQTNNATTDAIQITSTNGSVDDSGDSDTDLVAEQSGATTTITAGRGIGDGNALETSISRLDASSVLAGNIEIDEATSIELTNLDTVDGSISIEAIEDIQAIDVQTNETEAGEDNLDFVRLETVNGSIETTILSSADDVLLLAANGSIADTATGSLSAEGRATFAALTSIEFANSTASSISIGGDTSFNTALIRVGQDGQPAGAANANVEFGSLSLRADNAIITEDDSMLLMFSNRIQNDLVLTSGDSITNDPNTTIVVGRQTQLNAATDVFLGNQTGDEVRFGSLGVVATDAHFELDQGIFLNTNPADSAPPTIPISLTTQVEQTMYVRSAGEIVQTEGDINARRLALNADGHVHLESVGAFNESIAIVADAAAPLSNNNLQNRLDGLGQVQNGEVDSSLEQSIAFFHQGDAKIDSIASATGDPSATVVGIDGMNGSIFISAADSIRINEDVVALATAVDPQITVYVENATPDEPNIDFGQAEIRVSGGPQGNLGIVNAAQTTATFFDSEGFVFRGTTEFLILNSDCSAEQDIVLDYGHTGEEGYRIGVVWDFLSPEGNQNQPSEEINTYVTNPSDASEAYDDFIYQTNPNRTLQLNGVEGGRTTISKVDAYSKDAITNHQFDFRTFSIVTVRNDQNINLFAGAIDTVDNSLNESIETIRADLDSPKRFALPLPNVTPINPIGTRTVTDVAIQPTTPDDVTSSSFSRDVQPFETGELKWTRVKIPLDELESFESELRLKDPTKDYEQAEGAKEFQLDDDIGENEVERIINAIEIQPDAEPGYWYKIFKDYRNRDDELFFYHLKSGELPQPDTGPESDFSEEDDIPNDFSTIKDSDYSGDSDSSNEASPALQIDESTQPQDGGEPLDPDFPGGVSPRDGLLLENREDISKHPVSASASVGISASSLLIAGLTRQRKNDDQTNSKQPEKSPDEDAECPNSPTGFSHLDRLKRKLRSHLKRSLT